VIDRRKPLGRLEHAVVERNAYDVEPVSSDRGEVGVGCHAVVDLTGECRNRFVADQLRESAPDVALGLIAQVEE
jgi:hypothetical protein